MPSYICYFLNAKDATVATTHGTQENNHAAIKWAEGLLREHPDCTAVELWREARLVHRSPGDH